MYNLRAGFRFSVFIVCCTYVRTYVLTDSGSLGANELSNDIENRILFLAKFLEKVKSLTNESPIQSEVHSQRHQETSLESDFSDLEDVIRFLDAAKSHDSSNDIQLDKKDYAILPPASEWCRMMGFRRCRGSAS